MTTPAIIIRSVIIFILIVHQICAFQVPYKRSKNTDELNDFRIPRAEKLRGFMNDSVDPCFDFYEFACGNWKTLYPATEDTPITSPMIDLEDTVNKVLQVLLEEAFLSTDLPAAREIKNFYKSCMDSGSATQTIKQVFTDFVKQNSGMPAVQNDWNERSYNWVTQVSNLRRQFGMDIMIGVNIKQDRNRHVQIYIEEPSTLIPKHICKEGDFKNSRYYELKTEITDNMAYWFEMDKTDGSTFATELLNFETFLCRGMSEEVGPDVFPNITKISLNKLNPMYPRIKFSEFLTTSFEQPIPTNQLINLQYLGYFDHLSQVVQQTPKKLIANYIMYRALNYISFPEEYNNEKRASLCVDKCKRHFPKLIGEMFSTRNSHTETKEKIEQIRNNLIEAFKTDINSQSWIHESIRRQASKMISNMELSFPSYSSNFIFQEYGFLKIGRHFWKNLFNLLELDQRNEKIKLHANSNVKLSDGKDVESFNIKAGYMENTIQMPVALLQPPVYHRTAPNAYKYGILGYLIAREMIHSLDESNFSWEPNSTFVYKEKATCFRDQYVSYAGDNSGLSPEEIEENILEFITDNGALNISFNAYLEWLQKTDDPNILYDETLSNVDYTNTQLFFISFAQNFCSATFSNDEPTGLFPWDVPNYLEKFKVNGVLWNMKEFSREFNCLPGTEMNPGDKCSIY